MGLSTELLEDAYNMAAGLLQSKASKNQGRSCNVIYELALEVTHHHYCILLVTETSQPV